MFNFSESGENIDKTIEEFRSYSILCQENISKIKENKETELAKLEE